MKTCQGRVYIYGTDLRNGWQIISPSKSFTVYAATASEKSEWMAHISKCADDLITKREMNKKAILILNLLLWVMFEEYSEEIAGKDH